MVRLSIQKRKVLPEIRRYGNKKYLYSKTLISIPPNQYLEVSDEKKFSLFLNPEFKDFAKKPYLILPRKEDEYYVIVPRFIDLQIGWLYTQTPGYNVFIVNRYVRWIMPLPKELEQEMKFPTPHKIRIQGKELIVEEDLDWAWKRYRQHLSRRIDNKTIRIKKGHEFDLLAALIRDGVLPFTPQPVEKADLRPLRGKSNMLSLRDYQVKAWRKFLETGAIGVYWPPSAGKTFLGLYALARIRGKKLVVVPTRTLVEQWEKRIKEYTDLSSIEYQVITYHSAHKVMGKEFTLVIFDEHQHLPANTFSKLGMIKTKYRIGLTATPFREDGRTDLIFALSGFPVGIDWSELREKKIITDPEVKIILVTSLRKKLDVLEQLVDFSKKTLVFSDSLFFGERISKRLGVPFIHGGSKKRLEQIKENNVVVISRVGDEGISIDELETVIEMDFLFGSRRQELQRVGRLLHSKFKGEHYVIMTKEEFELYKKRFASLYEKGIKIKIVTY